MKANQGTTVYFYEREASPGDPGGYTVSKKPNLPNGDFVIDSYHWDSVTLWFVEADKFTEDERQLTYEAYCEEMGFTP